MCDIHTCPNWLYEGGFYVKQGIAELVWSPYGLGVGTNDALGYHTL
jgi:hypothetical protein